MTDPTAGRRFGTTAAAYDAARPGYPEAAFDRLVEATGVGPGGSVLEVGAGTGQATTGLLARGLAVVCLEPDARLAAILERNVGAHARVVVGDLEGYEPEPAFFDVLFGAMSLHWIPLDVLQKRADTGLRRAGFVVSLMNRHTTGPEYGFFAEVQAVYERHAPQLARGFTLPSPAEAAYAEPVVANLQGYGPALVEAYPWQKTYSAADYVRLLSTYSTHIELPEDARRALFEGIQELAARRYGGVVVKDYVAVLTVRGRTS